MKNIPCEAIRDLLRMYVEDPEALEGRELIKDHLAMCEDCQAYHQELTGNQKFRRIHSETTEDSVLKTIHRKQRNRFLKQLGVGLALAVILIYMIPMLLLKNMEISLQREELVIGGREQVRVTAEPKWLEAFLILRSSDESVVTLDENGMLTAVGAGEADITARIRNRAISRSIRVIAHPSLETLFKNYGEHSWLHLSADGKTLQLDTNPEDKEEGEIKEAMVAFASINEALLFPEDTYQRLNMLMDSEELRIATIHDITIQWTYTPGTGLEISYMQD